MELGILTIHGRIRHPQTQGKDESFNRAFTKEELKYYTPKDMADAAVRFREYRDFYNNIRPHHALGLEVPVAKYQRSERKLPSKIVRWKYGAECQLRKVRDSGYFTYNGHGFFLSEAFGGKEIAVRESRLPGHLTLLFRQFRIGRIDLEQRVYTTKRAYLLQGDPREG